MASAPSLVEALQAANPEAAASVKQLFSLAAGGQASGSGSSSSPAAADGTQVSNGFDQPSLTNFSSSTAVVTDLGVVGRGVKRAEPVAVAGGSALPSKKRSFDMLMNGSGNGETQVGFGEGPAKPTGEGTTWWFAHDLDDPLLQKITESLYLHHLLGFIMPPLPSSSFWCNYLFPTSTQMGEHRWPRSQVEFLLARPRRNGRWPSFWTSDWMHRPWSEWLESSAVNIVFVFSRRLLCEFIGRVIWVKLR